MDPLSAVTAAQELAGVCLHLVNQIKQLIEAAKGAKQALFDLVSRLERMRLILNEFKSLAQRLQNSPHHITITLAFNDGECRDTVRQLQNIVSRIAEETKVHEYWMRFNWIRHKDETATLLSRLARHESDLNSVLQFIAARSSITTEQEIENLRNQLESRPLLVDPFFSAPSEDLNEINAAEKDASSLTVATPSARPLQWLACAITDAYGPKYLEERETLSNAAYWGDWRAVLETIHVGTAEFCEQWANAYRLKPRSEVAYQSMWTPLHQAAFMGASTDVVQSLVELGASRTLRTRTTDSFLPYHDMIPFEIADSLGFNHLKPVLTPNILHYLPAETAVNLQDQLHKLIGQLLGSTVQNLSLRLPELSVIAELENPTLNIVLPEAAGPISISIYLDGRELLVRYVSSADGAHRQTSYRISTSGWGKIENALSRQP